MADLRNLAWRLFHDECASQDSRWSLPGSKLYKSLADASPESGMQFDATDPNCLKSSQSKIWSCFVDIQFSFQFCLIFIFVLSPAIDGHRSSYLKMHCCWPCNEREATVVKGVNDIKRIDWWKQRGRIYMGDVKKGGRRAVKTAALLPCLTPPLPSSVALLSTGE